MDLKVNNVIITDNILNINLNELNLEQQIIVLEEKNNYKNIQSYFLFSKPFKNIFCFNETNCNLSLETYNDITEMESKPEADYYSLLQIENNKIEILIDEYDSDSMYDFDEDCDNYKLIIARRDFMSEFNLNFSDSVTYNKKNNTIKISYVSLMDLNDCYLSINIDNVLNPKKYYWNKNINISILNKELNKYTNIKIEKSIKHLIDVLTNVHKNNQYSIQRCLDFLNVYNYSIKEIIDDNEKLYLIKKCFESVYCLEENEIEKYFKPVLIDEKNKFKAYFNSFYTYHSPEPYIIYKYRSDDYFFDKLTIFKRKAKSIIESLTQESTIDIYSGQCIDNDWIERYKDYEYLIITRKNKSESNNYSNIISRNEILKYYELIDNIYVDVDFVNRQSVRDTINDRIKLVKTLTE